MQSKIIGGVPSSIEKWPYIVSLRENNVHFGSGSIIAVKFILTAASCVIMYENRKPYYFGLTVVAGTIHREGYDGVSSAIAHIDVNKDYDPNEAQFSHSDIALVTVSC